jgi:DNA polymerase-1
VLLDWRQLSKLKGTYTENLIAAIAETGRVHTSYALAATTTGRLSSSDPNLQNIPIRTEEGRKIRKAFIAEPGKVLISADYSQIELRLLAHIGDIPQLKKAFQEGLDIHAMTASEMFGVPVEGMPSDVRRRAKAINFGIVYGISAFGLANQLSHPAGRGRGLYQDLFRALPRHPRLYGPRPRPSCRARLSSPPSSAARSTSRRIHAKSQAERQFGERAAINAPIQGAAADVIRRAMVRMPGALKAAGLSGRMLLQVHDELVFEAPADEADATCAVARQVMENAADPLSPSRCRSRSKPAPRSIGCTRRATGSRRRMIFAPRLRRSAAPRLTRRQPRRPQRSGEGSESRRLAPSGQVGRAHRARLQGDAGGRHRHLSPDAAGELPARLPALG